MQYVCGFMFARDFTMVALIRKNKPEWQRGKLNGIGGKVESRGTSFYGTPKQVDHFETPQEAMAREFEEETGYCTAPADWHLYRTERFPNGAVVHFLWAAFRDGMPPLRSTTDERVEVVEVYRVPRDLRGHVMYNLPYLIEMAVALARLEPHQRPLP